MKLNEYQELSKRTLPHIGLNNDVVNYALGLTGESGEVADAIKKWMFHDHELDREEIKKELGDVLHYLAGLSTMLGLNLEDVAQSNLVKLAKRYPNGFNAEDSKNRREYKFYD